MMPIILIIFGVLLIGLTLWDIRREEADLLFWSHLGWWDVNKTENPLLYGIAIVTQLLVAAGMIITGVAWLVFFH